MTMVFDTPEAIQFFRIVALKAALKLEIKGMRRSRSHPSAFFILKTQYGFKGSKAQVLEQVEAYVDELLQERRKSLGGKSPLERNEPSDIRSARSFRVPEERRHPSDSDWKPEE